jgi:hypothetical protein
LGEDTHQAASLDGWRLLVDDRHLKGCRSDPNAPIWHRHRTGDRRSEVRCSFAANPLGITPSEKPQHFPGLPPKPPKNGFPEGIPSPPQTPKKWVSRGIPRPPNPQKIPKNPKSLGGIPHQNPKNPKNFGKSTTETQKVPKLSGKIPINPENPKKTQNLGLPRG